MNDFMKNYDVLIVPSFSGRQLSMTNLTGHPVVVLPVANSRDGLPIGLQVVGRRWGEGRLVMAAGGGSLRAHEINHVMEMAGPLAWSAGTTAIDGIGRTVISGTTTGAVGNLLLGAPIAFAPGTVDFNSRNARVCLQGAAALPSGNLSVVNHAVLELGNGNFTRPLGPGAGEVQLPTLYGGGWAAVGADRSVNLGGAGATLLWGQTSPPFLYDPVFGVGGELGLGRPP